MFFRVGIFKIQNIKYEINTENPRIGGDGDDYCSGKYCLLYLFLVLPHLKRVEIVKTAIVD